MKLKYFSQSLLAAGFLLLPMTAHADLPGKHPHYLHALSDLRVARWMLEHRPGDAAVSGEEDVGIHEIDKAISENKHAAIDDGKDIHDHPNVDLPNDHDGRLHKAEDLLNKIHQDVNKEEDDPFTLNLKHHALEHIDAALHATEKAIQDSSWQNNHPSYLHALSDLRATRWLLEHRPGDAAVSGQEDVAIQQIDAAIGEIKHAAIDDGKDIHDHPNVEIPQDHDGRLRKAEDLLHKIHQDVDREEDDPAARGLKQRALQNIDGALNATRQALRDARRDAQ